MHSFALDRRRKYISDCLTINHEIFVIPPHPGTQETTTNPTKPDNLPNCDWELAGGRLTSVIGVASGLERELYASPPPADEIV